MLEWSALEIKHHLMNTIFAAPFPHSFPQVLFSINRNKNSVSGYGAFCPVSTKNTCNIKQKVMSLDMSLFTRKVSSQDPFCLEKLKK